VNTPAISKPAPSGLGTAAIAYTASNAMNRGLVWITMPLLTIVFDQAELGIYALSHTVATLLTPVFILNGSAAILREGTNDYPSAAFLLKRYSLLGLAMAAVVTTVCVWLPLTSVDWVCSACLLAISNGLYANVLADFQARNQYWRHLTHGTIKGLIVAGSILVAIQFDTGARGLLAIQSLAIFTHAIVLLIFRVRHRDLGHVARFGAALAFTLPLLPHSLSQWVMSSSDRIILKVQIDDSAVGQYSLAFAICALLVLINTGIGTALPRYAIRHFDRWEDRDVRRRVIFAYSCLAIVTAFITFALVHTVAKYSAFLDAYNVPEVQYMVAWLLAGQYMLGLYQIYATYLFYHRRSGLLATQTVCGAVVNVVLTILLVSQLGTRGAAIATFLGYVVYLFLVLISLGSVEKTLRRHAIQESVTVIAAVAAVVLCVFVPCSLMLTE
jgi:O-antigen/teichoic acid export membrane protein